MKIAHDIFLSIIYLSIDLFIGGIVLAKLLSIVCLLSI